jgi:aspartate/tyrosine/aromatic aminotransferase
LREAVPPSKLHARLTHPKIENIENKGDASMFETVKTAPPDPILGLTEAFNQDPSSDKINLSVGVYKDGSGKTPVLATVKEAERRLLENETTKSYLPMPGDPTYGSLVQKLMLGESHAIVTEGRGATAHCPGGTGALRVAGDYVHKVHPGSTLWLSDPTWANHPTIFGAAGLEVKTYAYRDPATNGLDFNAMLESLDKIPAGDVALLHGCCHNPTGIDPTVEQWAQIGELLNRRGVLPLVDFAYQGLATGLEEDAQGLRALCEHVDQMLVSSSFSKNFGLYRERTGALTIIGSTADQAKTVMSQLKLVIRANYSNPPAHGGGIVMTVLQDPELRAKWEIEVADIRDRINGMRHLFVDTLKAKGVSRDFSSIIQQRGMFSFSGLTKEQVEVLREKHAIYIVGSGRINVAGMTEANMDRLCEAVASVL